MTSRDEQSSREAGMSDLALGLAIVAAIHELVTRPDGKQYIQHVTEYTENVIKNANQTKGDRNDVA